MKILFLNNFSYLRGGSERVLFEEMRVLRNAGHVVAIYSRTHENNGPSEFSKYFPCAMDTRHPGMSMSALRTAGELIYSRSARLGLRDVIKLFRPDIAHAHNIYGRLSLSVLDELKAAKVPVVMTLHDFKVLCPSYLMLNRGRVCELCKGRRYYHAVLTRCHKGSYAASLVYAVESAFNHCSNKYGSVARFIAPSKFLRDKCIEYGMDAYRIDYLPNFIDADRFPVSGNSGKHILYFGRLSREKGIDTLLDAYKQISQDIGLIIVGDGPERKRLESRVAHDGLNVRFTGYLDGMKLRSAITDAKVVVMPSEWSENAPLSLLESFAYGKPVIGSKIGGIPELIDDGINGYLFETGNAAALKNMLEQVLSLNDETVAEMGQAARRKVVDQYGTKSHYENLMNIYAKVLAQKV